MTADVLLPGLPGELMMREGLADLPAGRETIPALLAAIASPRLIDAGLLSQSVPIPADAELRLYRKLGETSADPYAAYNALLRELVSFENALDGRMTRNGAMT